MRKVFILALLITTIVFSASGNSGDTIDKQDLQNKQDLIRKQECAILIASNATVEEVQRRGCCSWHGGVCGCSNGRTKCCDGTLSPTCGCD